jgi:hypothetical protein
LKKFVRLFVSLLAFSSIGVAQSVTVSSPSNGATVGSPVNFVASATGGSFPVTAMRIYVDNVSDYLTNSSSLNTSLALAGGGHYVVVQAWNSAGQVFKNALNITVGSSPSPSAGAVTVTSPGNGATVTSPVNFVAAATPVSGRVITAMMIYVDNNSDYTTNAASLNTSLSLAAGGHSVVVQAWDNTGAVYKSALSINVSTGGTTPTSGPYQNNLTATGNWMARSSVAPDGAILYGSSEIVPYYSNLAAIGLTKNPTNYPLVENWMKWYINHLNWPDQWGVYGTVYDYSYNNGAESSLNNADSTDSYAATFLSLAWAYYQTGDANAQSYIKTLSSQLQAIAGALLATQQSDGLTWAKPNYQIKYLMDNCEAYRGLRDAASLFQNAFNDATHAQLYNSKADLMLQGINGMWMGSHWAVYKDGIGRFIGPNMGTWYPDATSQMFPVMQNVIAAMDSRSVQTYNSFNAAWPGWPTLSFNSQDPFPWVMIGSAAAMMGDTSRTNTYITTLQNKYVNTGFPWTWYSMEAGWFMRLNRYMMGGRPM